MADTLASRSPLYAYSDAFASLAPAVTLTEEPFVTMVTLWADPEGSDRAVAEQLLGLALPATPSTAVSADGLTLIWMGPEEWLLASEDETPSELAGRLKRALSGNGTAVVDVSAQRTTIRLSGSHARDVLAKGCSLDLRPTRFRSGAAAQTTLALSEAVIIPLGDSGTDFRVLVRAAFAHYLAQWLIDAGGEYVTAHSAW